MSEQNVNQQEEKGAELDSNLVIQVLQQQLAEANYKVAILQATINQMNQQQEE